MRMWRFALCSLFALCCLLLSACYHASAADGDTDTDGRPDTAMDTGSDSGTAPDTALDSGTVPDSAPDTGVAPDTDIDTEPVIPVENEWIFIEGGTFEMGHVCDPPPPNNVTCSSEPVHTVTVPSFYMQKTEVTVHQYRQCVDAGACTFEINLTEYQEGYYQQCKHYDDFTTNLNPVRVNTHANAPIVCVSWKQAVEFCRWIDARLPSESEWEFASRSRGKDI
ncbi:MAG: SUMF1/EgtB/PvdO family nonheme iron enzyme, partial [Proteobacteria bacterium]|nr:SUMF1/EgtB/PvdO family nonheme iron enzyme [Pseudomonadota bacterium]